LSNILHKNQISTSAKRAIIFRWLPINQGKAKPGKSKAYHELQGIIRWLFQSHAATNRKLHT
jgi:hypothetical protein